MTGVEIAAIVTAIAATAVSAGTQVAATQKTKKAIDKRIAELKATPGLSREQRLELEAAGLGAVQAGQRELYSRMADFYTGGQVSGGDILRVQKQAGEQARKSQMDIGKMIAGVEAATMAEKRRAREGYEQAGIEAGAQATAAIGGAAAAGLGAIGQGLGAVSLDQQRKAYDADRALMAGEFGEISEFDKAEYDRLNAKGQLRTIAEEEEFVRLDQLLGRN
tara:strand:+ start:17656 stop:18318 length:663 start_codon:yes stop_codon:yes gene_type:complete